MKCLLTLFLLMPTISFAQSRFDGTWEMKMETLVFSHSPIEYLLDDGMFHCISASRGSLSRLMALIRNSSEIPTMIRSPFGW